jgi:transcription antitermination factor NusA-like protein
VKLEDDSLVVTIQPKDRVLIIGKNGETIRVVRDFLKRHYNINNLKLRM